MTGVAAVVLLVVAGAYPVAVAVHAPAGHAAWPVLVTVVVAVAARAGALAGRGETARRRPWTVPLALAAAGASADVGLRVVLRLAGAEPVAAPVVTASTLATGALVAGSWLAARRLAERMAEAVTRSLPAGDVQPVGYNLLAGGCLVLAAAGWAHWSAPGAQWHAAGAGLAVVVYAVAALLTMQGLRRAALWAGWTRAHRPVHAGVARNWALWVVMLLAGAVALASLWWLPALGPVRDGAGRGAPEAVSALRDYLDRSGLSRDELQRPRGVAGESMPGGEPASTDDDRRVVVVRRLLDWLLDPAAGFGDGGEEPAAGEGPQAAWGVPPRLVAVLTLAGLLGFLLLRRADQRRRRGNRDGLLAAARQWWWRLAALLAAMLGRDPAAPRATGRSGDQVAPGDRAVRLRPWRRPSAPREQVKHDYGRVLDQARRRGLPRHRAQSPSEYARTLGPQLPGRAGDIDDLTEAFVQARYSRHPIDAAVSDRTREASRRLRRALKDRERTPSP